MGIQIEFNPDLALRNIIHFEEGRRFEEECIPQHLESNTIYDFLKKGARAYWLHGEIPLVETSGDGKISPPIASIIIQKYTHFIQNETDEESDLIHGICTEGKYRVIKVFEPGDPTFEGFERVS